MLFSRLYPQSWEKPSSLVNKTTEETSEKIPTTWEEFGEIMKRRQQKQKQYYKEPEEMEEEQGEEQGEEEEVEQDEEQELEEDEFISFEE
jgi:hypothetical protein